MNSRIAKKIRSQHVPPHLKPSAALPYTDQQIAEAARLFRRAFGRAVKAHPGVDRMDLRLKWQFSPASVPRRVREGERRLRRARPGAPQ